MIDRFPDRIVVNVIHIIPFFMSYMNYCLKSCFDYIVENDTHNNIAIASHGGVTRALCWCCGYKVDRDVNTAHCFHFVLDDGKWQFIEEFEPEMMQKC